MQKATQFSLSHTGKDVEPRPDPQLLILLYL